MVQPTVATEPTAVPTIAPIPVSDRDHDGIVDADDNCPDQYGIPEFNGCDPFKDDNQEPPSTGGDDNGDDGRGDGGDGRE